MEPKYLIDTNVVIDYLGNKIPEKGMNLLNAVLNNQPNVSIITKIEVLGFNTTSEHYLLLKNFMDDVHIVALNDAVAKRTIAIRKLYKTKLPDAIIAATAIEFGLTLITRNITDFKKINTLDLINPHQ